MSQQVRFAPANSLDVVYVRHGHVTISRADGTEVAIAPGHHPDWVDGMRVVFCNLPMSCLASCYPLASPPATR
jgi:hypothetical protein